VNEAGAWDGDEAGRVEEADVCVGLMPGIERFPSSTVKPPETEVMSVDAMDLISGLNAINAPATTTETRAAMRAYSTNACPFSLLKVLNMITSPFL